MMNKVFCWPRTTTVLEVEWIVRDWELKGLSEWRADGPDNFRPYGRPPRTPRADESSARMGICCSQVKGEEPSLVAPLVTVKQTRRPNDLGLGNALHCVGVLWEVSSSVIMHCLIAEVSNC